MIKRKKRGQVFSIDLIFAVIIFLVAVALFYYNIAYVPQEKIEKKIKIDEDFLFQNIEDNTKSYDESKGTDTSFLSDFRIDEKKLTNFAQIKYKDFTEILFKNIIVTGLDVDTCLYFTNRSNHIVPVYNGEKHITGVGNSTNEFIVIENKSCGTESENKTAAPNCWGNYELTRLFSKPVLMKKTQYSEIISMNILVCAREKGSTLFLPRPEEPEVPLPPPPPTPTCSDGIQNQDETGIDCGGSCDACELPEEPVCGNNIIELGEECDDNNLIDGDGCSSICETEVEIPTCSDGIQNQDEEDIDCGGSCDACEEPPVTPTCSDGIQNQDEEDIDCGGSCDACEEPSEEEEEEEIIEEEIPTCSKTNDGIELCGNNVDEDCDGIKRKCPPGCRPRNNGFEICGNNIDENCDGKDKKCTAVDCTPKNNAIEICGNNIDEDCDDEDMNCVPGCIPTGIEICGNNIDENCNGFDDACINLEQCTTRECRLTSGITHKKRPVWFGFFILVLLIIVFVFFMIIIYHLVLKKQKK